MGIRYVYLDETELEHRIDLDQTGNESATNNQMELRAVIEGIRQSTQQDIQASYNSIEVRTDSRYVVDNKNNAVYSWSKNGWLNRDGKPVENAQLWKELIKVIRNVSYRIEIVWVKGHSLDQDNRAVDRLARKSAKSLLDPPLVQSKLRRKKSDQKTKKGSIEMKGQRVSIHVINDEYMKLQKLSKYRYEIISPGSEYFQKLDTVYSELHHLRSGHKHIVTFNANNKNPRILKLIRELG